ncbi:hypothetical protein D3C75_994320 [compost metagenome]
MAVVQVERRAADEGQLAFSQKLNRAHVVGFHQQLAVVAQAPQAGEFGSGFDQGQARQYDLRLRAFLQLATEAQPMLQVHRPAFRADGFAKVNHIQRQRGHLGIETPQLLLVPVIQNGSQAEFHLQSLIAMIDGKHPGWSGCLRINRPAPGATGL